MNKCKRHITIQIFLLVKFGAIKDVDNKITYHDAFTTNILNNIIYDNNYQAVDC